MGLCHFDEALIWCLFCEEIGWNTCTGSTLHPSLEKMLLTRYFY